MKPYEERVLAADKPGMRAADVRTLIGETEALIAEAKAAEAGERAKASDPTLSEKEALEGHRLAEEYAFTLRRLKVKHEHLETVLAQKLECERAKAREAEHAEAVGEREKLVEEWRGVPEIIATLTDLFKRTQANEQRLGTSAEQIARGVNFNLLGTRSYTQMAIPRFDGPGSIWPPDPLAAVRAQTAAQAAASIREVALALQREREQA